VCPILMRQDGTRAGHPQPEVEGVARGTRILFACAPLSDCSGSRRCRLLRRRGSSRGGRPGHFSNRRDARRCRQPLLHDPFHPEST
jgi:hypothetical protein